MPSTKCDNCGHRIIFPTTSPTCPSCGVALPSHLVSEETALFPTGAQSQGSSSGAFTPPFSSPRGTGMGPDPMGTTMPNDFGTIFTSPFVEDQPKRKYPLGLPWWSPNLEGIVIGLQPMSEDNPRDWLSSMFMAIRDMIWPMPVHAFFRDQPQSDRVTITMVRLRISDDTQRDARLVGFITGANIALGDQIALWGRKRRGVLIIRRGYNNTSRALITTTKNSQSPLALLVFFAALVMGYALGHYALHMLPTLPLPFLPN